MEPLDVRDILKTFLCEQVGAKDFEELKSVTNFRNVNMYSNILINDKKYMVKDLLKYSTSYLENPTLKEIMYNIKMDVTTRKMCEVCNINPVKFQTTSNKYSITCSKECRKKIQKQINKKREDTNLKKFGVKYTIQNHKIKEKTIQTNLKKFGSTNPFGNKDIQQKIKDTNIKKYGVENPQQNHKIKEKTIQTTIERYGVEYPSQSIKIKEKTIQTNRERYGVDWTLQNENVQQKIKDTNIERYGHQSPLQNENVQQKIKDTNIERYGVEYPLQSIEIQENRKKTNIERYGVEYPLQSIEIQEKTIQTNLKKYGTEWTLQNKNIRNKMIESSHKNFFNKLINSERLKSHYIPLFNVNEYDGVVNNGTDHIGIKYKWQCVKCGTIFEDSIENGILPRCPTCYPIKHSMFELDVIKFLNKHNISNIIHNDRKLIKPLELDIIIPEFKLAIECNGIYYHTEKFIKDKQYHINKTYECLKQGYQLIHIFEDEWVNKQEIVKSIILNKLKMNKYKAYARQCTCKEITNNSYLNFLDTNHLHGQIYCKRIFGLYYKNEILVSLLCIGKTRFDKSGDYEIYRFCNQLNTTIVGGLGKLLSFSQKQLKYNKLISYVDLRFGTGIGYKKCGFKYVSYTMPGYYYFKGSLKRESRQKYKKHKIKELFEKGKLQSFDETLTEEQNMQLNGYFRIWDCGNAKYIIEY